MRKYKGSDRNISVRRRPFVNWAKDPKDSTIALRYFPLIVKKTQIKNIVREKVRLENEGVNPPNPNSVSPSTKG